jgi:hypothetical protein
VESSDLDKKVLPQEKGLCRERRKGLVEGGKLEVEDVASGTEEAKAA